MADVHILVVLRHLYVLEEDGEGGSRHAARLHHEGHVPGHVGLGLDGEGEDGVGHGPATLARHTCRQRHIPGYMHDDDFNYRLQPPSSDSGIPPMQ